MVKGQKGQLVQKEESLKKWNKSTKQLF